MEIVSVKMSLDEQVDFVLRLLQVSPNDEQYAHMRKVLMTWGNDLLSMNERAMVAASVRGMSQAAERIRSAKAYDQAKRRRTEVEAAVARTPSVTPEHMPVSLEAHRLHQGDPSPQALVLGRFSS